MRVPVTFIVRNEKILFGSLVFITFLIAYLQVLKLNLGIITAYGADFFAPIVLYYFARKNIGIFALFRKDPLPASVTFLLILGACIAWETRQFINPVTGVFDLYDILTYAFSLSICYLLDKYISNLLTEQNC